MRKKDDDSGKGALPWSGAGHEEQVFMVSALGNLRITAIRDGVYLLQWTATERL